MLCDWPTEANDWQTAQNILEKYLELNGGEPLGIIDVVVTPDEERVDYEVSTWIKELTAIYCQQYGREQGEVVTKRVVSRCLTLGHTIH